MADPDPIMQTRLDVAEMKGMLSQVVSSHEARLLAHDLRLDGHEARLNDKSKFIARHDERIEDTEEDIKALKDDNTGRLGRNLGVAGLSIAALTGLLAVFNFLNSMP